MKYKYLIFKKLLLLLTFFLLISIIKINSEEIYGIISMVKSNISLPVMKYNDNSAAIKINDKVLPGATILTVDDQSAEIILYKDNNPIGILLIMENTDFRFNYDNSNQALNINIIYGGIRGVISDNTTTIVNSKTVHAETNNGDFCLISIANKESQRSGYLAVFDGNVTFISNQDINNTELVKNMQMSDFLEYKINPPQDYKMENLIDWKNNLLFATKDIPKNINLALETFTFKYGKEKEEKKEKKTTPIIKKEKNVKDKKPVKDQTTDVTKEEKKIEKVDKDVLLKLLNIELGSLKYNDYIASKLVWFPTFYALKDKLEFGLYLPVNIIPYAILTKDRFLNVNINNNEWSFGSDKYPDTSAMVFDIVDDLLLKFRRIKYNNPEDMFYIHFGDYFGANDFLQYSLIDFNSKIFYPYFRKSSFVTTIKTNIIDTLIYAEDVMPKGIYGTDLTFKTPNKIGKLLFRVSGFIDCYDLVKFTNEESFFPAQFNTSIAYMPFDVQTFGFSIFISGGILLPFSYNNYTKTSMFGYLAGMNPSALAANISGNIGFLLRISDFRFSGEVILDSGLNKIGLFDTLYFAKRENRKIIISSWIDDLYNRPTNITDFNFGLRTKLSYNFQKYLFIDLVYQITFPNYYDKLYLKIGYDSIDTLKFNFSIYNQLQIETLCYSFSNFKYLMENTIAYIGSTLKPCSGIDINLNCGIFPLLLNEQYPWYIKLVYDLSISLYPDLLYKNYQSVKGKKL